MSIAPGQTLKWAVQQMLVILAYFLLRILAGRPETLRHAVRALIAVGALEGAYAVICFYSNILFGTTFGVEVGQYGTFPGTYGTLFEANFLGAFSAACLVMALSIYLQERRKTYLVAAALTFAGLIIALSRAAIIAGAIALLVLYLFGKRKRVIDRRAIKAVAVTLLATGLVLASAIIPLYIERFSTVEVSDITADPDTALRIVSIGMAVDDIVQHPILGNGNSSFNCWSAIVSWASWTLMKWEPGWAIWRYVYFTILVLSGLCFLSPSSFTWLCLPGSCCARELFPS